MHMFKGLFDLLIVAALIGGGFWSGWTTRSKTDPLIDAYGRADKARVAVIDTLTFWD